jgi:hypothetical protein
MQAPANADIPLKFNLQLLPLRCSQAVLVGIGFVPVVSSVNNTNPWTALGSTCLAGARAASASSDVTAAGRQQTPDTGADDRAVSIQGAETTAVFEQTCVKGTYAVTVQAPDAAGCYYFGLRLADASRQIIVLRVTEK